MTKEKQNKPLSLISFSEIREGCLVKTEVVKDYRGFVVRVETLKTNKLFVHILGKAELQNFFRRAIERMVER